MCENVLFGFVLTSSISPVAGPWALFKAFRSFRQDAGIHTMNAPPFESAESSPIREGTWVGTGNRSVTFAGRGGTGQAADHFIIREVVNFDRKPILYQSMGMSYHRLDQTKEKGRLCLDSNILSRRMPDFRWKKVKRNFLGS